MDEDIEGQIVDHCSALAMWILNYIEKNNLPVAESEGWDAFQFHLGRLEALLALLECPLRRNPIIKRKFTDDDQTKTRQNP